MEILIFAVALLVAAFGLVAWLRLSDDLRDRDEWERFQQAMADAQNPHKEN
jgi:HAMP domain-containing protein